MQIPDQQSIFLSKYNSNFYLLLSVFKTMHTYVHVHCAYMPFYALKVPLFISNLTNSAFWLNVVVRIIFLYLFFSAVLQLFWKILFHGSSTWFKNSLEWLINFCDSNDMMTWQWPRVTCWVAEQKVLWSSLISLVYNIMMSFFKGYWQPH